MKIAVRALVAVMLSVVTTILIAWSAARWANASPSTRTIDRDGAIVDMGSFITMTLRRGALGPKGAYGEVWLITECGWPHRSLRSTTYLSIPKRSDGSPNWGGTLEDHSDWRQGLLLSAVRERQLVSAITLPVEPLWPGFAIDSVPVGCAVLLALSYPDLVRRLRKAQGRCRRCGYLLHNSPRCPECGSEPA
jgi:hypothetical protein